MKLIPKCRLDVLGLTILHMVNYESAKRPVIASVLLMGSLMQHPNTNRLDEKLPSETCSIFVPSQSIKKKCKPYNSRGHYR
jgi:hypothetical protein